MSTSTNEYGCNFSHQNNGSNPLHQHDDRTWWFYDETWANEHGPFDCEADAKVALKIYADNL